LDGAVPHVKLAAVDAKNGRAADIRLRSDLVRELKDWLQEKLGLLQE
jgi:hypothetical protein